MASYVIDPREETRVPFLRGILTRSLQNTGLPFSKAYDIADRVRKHLNAKGEITMEALSALVLKQLQAAGYHEAAEAYERRSPDPIPILVRDREGNPQPFSKARLAQALEICAFPADKCYAITLAIEQQLLAQNIHDISSLKLAHFTYEYLYAEEGKEMAHRYAVWFEFSRSGRPLILLIGGTTGCGKSTISAELAHRLNIVRTQSTDMLREVMRLMVPKRLVPSLHESSFNAWETLPGRSKEVTEAHLLNGYLTQAAQVSVGIEGVLHRAEREQISLILEGVHIHPALQHRMSRRKEALIVPLVLAVMRRKHLHKRLVGRGQQVMSRRSQRYLENFDAIWQMQSYMLAEAERLGIAIIPNDDQEATIKLIMETLSDLLCEIYKGNPKTIFAPAKA